VNRMKLWRAVALIGSMALVLAVAACGDDDDDDGGGGPSEEAAEASFDLTIGGIFPLTGDLSQFGPTGQNALELAVKEANSAAKEAGAEITVEGAVEDDETNPQSGQSAATKLVSDGASCMVAAYASGVTIPIAESVSSRQSVPQITPASTAASITELEDNGFVFRTAPSDALQAQVLADAVEQDLGGTDFTLSLAARNDPYGDGLINAFKESWEEKGGQTTEGSPVLYDPEQASFNSEADQILSGNPDAYVIVDFEDPYAKVGAALVRSGDFDGTKLFTADGLAFGSPISRTTVPEQALDGARGTRPVSPEQTSAAKAFDALVKESGTDRNTFDAQTFDAGLLCFLGAVAAGSAEGEAIKDQLQAVSSAPGTKYTWEQLPQAVEALRNGDDIDFEGVSGPIDFDENGDPTAAMYEVFEYENGRLNVTDSVDIGGGGGGGGEE
jgi:ABC-type branched-subunit amino acid transport system substrate-binding protein